MPTYHVIYGGQKYIDASTKEEAYRQFWAWVIEQAEAGDFGLVVNEVGEQDEVPLAAAVFYQCRTDNHPECIGSSREIYKDHRLVQCQCACHQR